MRTHWIERKIIYDTQEVNITPGDVDDCIEMDFNDIGETRAFTLFLSFDEARELARQILNYCEMETTE